MKHILMNKSSFLHYSSIDYTQQSLNRIFSKKGSTGISKNLHATESEKKPQV